MAGGLRLNDETVAELRCPEGKKDALFFDLKVKGFGVRVTASGLKVFLYQYRVGPKIRRHKLGEFPTTSSAKARRLAEVHRGTVQAGADPVADRKAKETAVLEAETSAKAKRAVDAFTVKKLIEGWQSGHLSSRSASYRLEAPRRLLIALGPLAELPAKELDRTATVGMLDAFSAASGAIGANRVRAYGRACFGWAVSRGSVVHNPFDNVPRLAQERARERVLTEDELHRVWVACAQLDEPWRPIFQILILTGQRRGEVAGMRWSELHLEPADRATWSLPGSRTKNGHPHDVPLSEPARAILAEVKRFAGCPLVLSLGRKTPPSGFGKAKARLDVLLAAEGEQMAPWTVHDLRRTVATGLQRQGVRLEVTEAVLNHVSGSRGGIVGVYQRHAWTEEKRAALEAWAGKLKSCPSPVHN